MKDMREYLRFQPGFSKIFVVSPKPTSLAGFGEGGCSPYRTRTYPTKTLLLLAFTQFQKWNGVKFGVECPRSKGIRDGVITRLHLIPYIWVDNKGDKVCMALTHCTM